MNDMRHNGFVIAGTHRVPPQSSLRIFAIPLLIAILTLVGLVVGLTGHEAADVVSWICLTLPIAIFVRMWRNRS